MDQEGNEAILVNPQGFATPVEDVYQLDVLRRGFIVVDIVLQVLRALL